MLIKLKDGIYVIKFGGAMNKYKVEIEETLARIIEIEAENEDETYMKVKELYKKCEIVLTSYDFCCV